ncbi:MAG: N-acetylneuraminate synthase family protein [Candidatus Hodarchaeota archaeon]
MKKKDLIIGDRVIGEDFPVFFIAEIGINHNGDLDIAKKIIDIASFCNVDAVKFQKRDIEISIPMEVRDQPRETPWGIISYFEYKKKLEFGEVEYKEIEKYCKDKKILWSVSVWDIPSLEFMMNFDVPFIKIPSAQLTNKELLLATREINKPILLGTGMSTEDEIKKAIKILENVPLVIMHCNSAYPAMDGDLNLSYIKKLIKLYPDHIIGYSGHEQGIAASLVAATLGAKVIERHVTIDRAMWGTDQAASIEFSGLRRIVRDTKKLPIWIGDGIKRVTESELQVKRKLRNVDTL